MIPDPAFYARRIALFVTGLNPQVVTETLWSLAHASSPFVPTEISLLTTTEGRSRALLLLLPSAQAGSEGPAALAALGRDIGVPKLGALLPLGAIHVIRDAAGTPLDDIADEAANIAAADAITGLIRDFTADPAAALHVSIAGGRKTMGFLAGYALSLFGRPQDRLS
ncbi:MAG: CRISPR-associated ring nuclease Csm6, partial [Acetobacteraceae bacterium]